MYRFYTLLRDLYHVKKGDKFWRTPLFTSSTSATSFARVFGRWYFAALLLWRTQPSPELPHLTDKLQLPFGYSKLLEFELGSLKTFTHEQRNVQCERVL